MPEKFSITGVINITPPTNLKQIASQIKNDLSTPIPLNLDAKQSAAKLAKDVRDAFRRYGVPITLVSNQSVNDIAKSIQRQLNGTSFSLNIKVANLKQIGDNIAAYLQGRTIPVNIAVNQTSVNTATKGLKQIGSTAEESAKAMENLARQTALTIRRFGVYTVATAAFFKLNRAIREGIKEAIAFDAQFIKIRQVTKQSTLSLSQLTKEIGKLSSGLGVSSKELLSASQVLSQAGFSAREVNKALSTLAKTSLAPTFDSINQVAEGSIAIMNQFGLSVDDLESKFSSINAVAAKFAVESSDLITSVTTTGGAFAAAGGDFEQLIGLFTSVRQTTRASAASIAVGLKTISTRLQRGRTQSFLKDLGIDLKFTGEEARKLGKEGLFVGVYESIRRISSALKSIPKNDPRFAQIAEELGGFRQIDKVIPLLTEFELAERARGVAIREADSLTKDSIIAQESLANQFAKVREQFNLLIREIIGSDFIRSATSQFLTLASAAIKLAETLEKVAVPLTIILGFRLAKTTGQLGKLVIGNLAGKSNLPVFAAGGNVPGVGNKDTVQALLTPGEYVINKRAVKQLGQERLDILNQGKLPAFNKGGSVGGIQTFQNGGPVSGGSLLIGGITLAPFISSISKEFSKLEDSTRSLITSVVSSGLQFLAFSAFLKPSQDSINNFTNSLKESRRAIQTGISDTKRQSAPGIERATNLDNRAKSNLAASRANFSRRPNVRTNARLQAAERLSNQTGIQKQTLIEDRDRALAPQKEQLRVQKDLNKAKISEFRNAQRLNTALLGTTAALSVVSQYFNQLGKQGLEAIRSGDESNIDSSRRNAGIGAGLGGAVGTGVGAVLLNQLLPTLGIAAFSPPVLAATAAIGALSYGVYQAVSAVKEFDNNVRGIQISRIGDDLSKSLQKVSSGQSNVFVQRNSVLSNLGLLRNRLTTESNPQNREDINAAIDSSINGLQEFIDNAKESSVSLAQFNSVIPTETLEFFARRTGQSLKDLVSNIKTTIQSQSNFNKRFEQSVLNLQAFETRLIAEVALSSAIEQSVSGLDRLNTVFSNIESGSINTDTSSALSDRLGSLGSVADLSRFESDIKNFTSFFGNTLNGVADESINAAKAIKFLPNILLDLRSTPGLEGSGEIVDRLRDTLSGLGISGAIRDTILNEISGFGEGGKGDAGIIDAIGKNLTGILGNISDSLSSVGSSLEEAARKVNDELSIYAQGLESANQAILAADNRFASTFNIRRNLSNTVSERPNFGAQQNLLNQEQNFATSGRGTDQVFADLINSQKELVSLNEQLANTTDIQERKNLISLQREQALRIQRANQALDFLADASNRASVLESQLNKEREARQTRRGFADRITFSTAEERAGINRSLGFARAAASAGTIDVVPEALRKEVQSLLSEIGDARIAGLGGRSGTEILDQLVANSLRSAGVNPEGIIAPSKKESGIASEIARIFQESEKIQIERGKLESQNANNFITNLGTSFTNFLSGLRETILGGQRATADQEILSIRNNLVSADRLRGAGQQLQRLSGIDPETLVANFQAINQAFNDVTETTSSLNKFTVLLGKAGKELDSRGLPNGLGSRKIFATKDFTSDILGDGDGFTSFSQTEFAKIQQDIIEKFGKEFGTVGSNFIKKSIEDGLFADELNSTNVRKSKIEGSVQEALFSLQLELIKNKEISKKNVKDLSTNVGGEENLQKIISNRNSISQILGQLPEKVQFSDLSKNIQNLETQLKIANQKRAALGFNSGGYVPGSGSTDTVPAMLTPGEVVINKSAVQRIGAQNLLRLNSGSQVQKFNQGGIVQSIDQSSLGIFNSSVNTFMNGLNTIAQALSNIPSKIEMTGNHRVEVVINGSQVLNNIMPEISNLVKGEIKRSINRLITERFPEQGAF